MVHLTKAGGGEGVLLTVVRAGPDRRKLYLDTFDHLPMGLMTAPTSRCYCED